MADTKVSNLDPITTLTSDDLLYAVDGTTVSKKITFANFEGAIDHVNINNIGTKTHAQIDTHIADVTDAHTISSDNLTFTNKTIDDFSNTIDADEIHVQVRNESGSEMVKGNVFYISGYSVGEDKPLVSLADANGSGTFPAVGMISETIGNNATGHATVQGRVTGIDTSAFSVGDSVYMSETPGAISTRPSATASQVQALGIVLRSHASLGVLELEHGGRTNDIPNDIDHATDLQNVGNNTHAQIDTSVTAQGVNSTHVAGDGSDHADVASNTTHRGNNNQAHTDYLKNDAADVGVGLTLSGDNNTGDTQYTAQVLHGTDASPPTASNFPRGTIYIQYTA